MTYKLKNWSKNYNILTPSIYVLQVKMFLKRIRSWSHQDRSISFYDKMARSLQLHADKVMEVKSIFDKQK